jgi:Mn2+/Fe2+ NRAMP family transporter
MRAHPAPPADALSFLTLLASGQNSTLTGTLAGQIVMEGFLNIGTLVNPLWLSILAYVVATVIALLNGWLLFQTLSEWVS